MKIKLKKKKYILIILTVVMLIIFLSNYSKPTEIALNLLFNQNNFKSKTASKEIFFEADSKNGLEKEVQQKLEFKHKNKSQKKVEKAGEVEKIALVKDIKDPFKSKQKNSRAAKDNSAEELLPNRSLEDLILLEKNITSSEMIVQNQNGFSDFLNSPSAEEINKKSISTDSNDKSIDKRNSNSINSLKKKNLPFKLLGIIKNKNNSSALFRYQGQTLLKKEKEKIDIFKIKKINNKNLVITYQNEEKTLQLWKEKNNEN